jgi:hypothetical protein
LDRTEIEDRIRHVAKNTDALIVKLDTLTSRIDTARTNENKELVEYYEKQFAETSVEFMDGVETILDGWYALNGIPRPPADHEILDGDTLDVIHNTVVEIVQGQPGTTLQPQITARNVGPAGATGVVPSAALIEEPLEQGVIPRRTSKRNRGGKVDLTG